MLQPAPAFRFSALPTSGGHSHEAVQWLLKRHCSLTPAQLRWLDVSLCMVSLARETRLALRAC